MSWLETRWIYLYVALLGGAMAALVTALSGDGVDWALTALTTLALLVGTFIGRLIKARRETS